MARALSTQDRALRLLAMRGHGVEELRRKLVAKGCPPDEIRATLENLQRTGLLDDRALVQAEVERLQAAGRGGNAIRAKLLRRGLSGELVGEALAELSGEIFEDEALRALRKRFGAASAPLDDKARLRALRFLAGRGFSQDQAWRALARWRETPRV